MKVDTYECENVILIFQVYSAYGDDKKLVALKVIQSNKFIMTTINVVFGRAPNDAIICFLGVQLARRGRECEQGAGEGGHPSHGT